MHAEEEPDAGWVAVLSGSSHDRAADAIAEAGQQRRLFGHLEREHRSEGRASYIEIDAPLELHALVRLLRPEHVLEVGVSSGVSSAYLLHGLDMNGLGTLHSIDLPSRPRRARGRSSGGSSWSLPPGRSSGWAVPDSLRGRWDLRLGDKAELLPRLATELPRVDLFVYDVPHDDDDAFREFATLDPRMAAGSVAIIDHGPGGGLCGALQRWARRRGVSAVRRRSLGLYGSRFSRRPSTRADRARSGSRGGRA